MATETTILLSDPGLRDDVGGNDVKDRGFHAVR